MEQVPDELQRRAIGCPAGTAIGDAPAGSAEGHRPDDIRHRYGAPVTGIGQRRITAHAPTRGRHGRHAPSAGSAAVSLWLNSGMPATEVARRAGHR
jgi:hypothetical protein